MGLKVTATLAIQVPTSFPSWLPLFQGIDLADPNGNPLFQRYKLIWRVDTGQVDSGISHQPQADDLESQAINAAQVCMIL
jgi:hypothetical protein